MSRSQAALGEFRVPAAGTWFALVWTIGTAGFLLFGPVYRSVSSEGQSGRNALTAETTSRSSGLAAREGSWAFVLVSFPVRITAAPLVVARRAFSRDVTAGAGGLLGAFAVLGAASIGLLYVPPVVALVAAAAVPRRRRSDASSPRNTSCPGNSRDIRR